jgi:hypothetical protein
MTMILPYSCIRTNFAETVGPNSATWQETASRENVPQAQESGTENSITDSEDEGEEEEDEEWANYWPPSPPSSDAEDEEEQDVTPETESRSGNIEDTDGNKHSILNQDEALTDHPNPVRPKVGGPRETKGQTPELNPGYGTGRASRCNHIDARTDSSVKEEATKAILEDQEVRSVEVKQKFPRVDSN